MNGFLKQPQQIPGIALNAGAGMTVVGGAINTAPSGLQANQGMQDVPGDRMMLDSADADALSDTSVGQLYGGIFQFIQAYLSATAVAAIAHLAFWQTDSADPGNYIVTGDEDDFIAGVFINTLTDGNYGWIQTAGQVDCQSISTLAVATQGAGVYAARLGAGANVGRFTQFAGTYSNATNEEVDNMFNRYMGQAVELPVAGTATLINIPMSRIRV